MRFKNLNLEAPAETLPEKFMGLPLVNNALGRWVKVSDRGIADADRTAYGPGTAAHAEMILGMQPVLDKLAKGEAVTASEKALLMRPEALEYLRRRLPEVMQAKSHPDLRRLNDAPNAEARAVVLQRILAERKAAAK